MLFNLQQFGRLEIEKPGEPFSQCKSAPQDVVVFLVIMKQTSAGWQIWCRWWRIASLSKRFNRFRKGACPTRLLTVTRKWLSGLKPTRYLMLISPNPW
jgi:hypothetical protein